MKKNRIYTKHKAFGTAYNQILKKSNNSDDGFVRPTKYHHNPKKLMSFTSYVGYFHWSNELYIASSKLITMLRRIYDRAEITKLAWYDSKNGLNILLNEYERFKLDLNNLYDDIFEFQNCMLATDISEKQAQIQALSDQVRLLDTLENKIIETCNRKLYEISSSRVTVANLSISIIAIIISVLSIYYSSR